MKRKCFPVTSSADSSESFNPDTDLMAILGSREIGKSGENIIMIKYHDPSLGCYIVAFLKNHDSVNKVKGIIDTSKIINSIVHS